MAVVKVLRRFRDLKHHIDREVGETFEATEERAAQIAAALPGYVTYEVAEARPEPEPVDLTKLTVATLKALCKERGVEVPAKAKKADLIALLDKE